MTLTKILLTYSFTFFIGIQINAQAWNQQGIDIDGTHPDGSLGMGTAMSSDGNIIAASASGVDGLGGLNLGNVYFYDWDGTAWIKRTGSIWGENPYDYSGTEIKLNSDGTVVAIGSLHNDDGGSYAGHIRIFEYNGISWDQRGNDFDGIAANDKVGETFDLSADGNTIVYGGDRNNIQAQYVRTYDWNGTTWIQRGSDLIGSNYDSFGKSVAISDDGNSIIVGIPRSDEGGNDAGGWRSYTWNGSSWIQKGNIVTGLVDEKLGEKVSMNANGNIIAVSSLFSDNNGTNSGHVATYQWNGGSWTQMGTNIIGEFAGDLSGSSIAINDNGYVLIIGAKRNTGIGAYAGHARIFEWNGTAWIQVGFDIDAEETNDNFATSVAISGDGNKIAAGAPGNGTLGCSGGGQVRAFNAPYHVAVQKLDFDSKLAIFPNPTRGDLTIDLGTLHSSLELRVTNALGQTIEQCSYKQIEHIQLELKGNSGVYFVEIISNLGQRTTFKIIKK